MSTSHWRGRAAPIIASILAANPGKPERELRKLLAAAFPFGPRAYHPYKVWCDEINRQLGKKPPLGTKVNTAEKAQAENPDQGKLFR